MNYLNLWKRNLLSRSSLILDEPIILEGLRDKHLGPMMEYAKIKVKFEPCESLDVDISLIEKDLNDYQLKMIRYAIFGLFDVLICAKMNPLIKVRIIFISVEFDDINSNAIAFRHAGRDAGYKLMRVIRY